MALTKEVVYDRIEVIGEHKAVHCREATIVKENGKELSRSFHRHFLMPSGIGLQNEDGTYNHTDTDISGEPAEAQAVCNAVWTDAVKAAWKTKQEADMS